MSVTRDNGCVQSATGFPTYISTTCVETYRKQPVISGQPVVASTQALLLCITKG